MFGIGVGIRVGGRTPVGGSAYDADAQAFFDRVTTAGGSLTTTEKNATNQLVLDMKSAGIWTAMKAIYPMVGASAAACAQNLKSSSFTGTFTSGWTFASTGVTGNGTSAYMTTGFVPSIDGSLNNAHLCYYSRTQNSGGNGFELGSSGGTDEFYLTYAAFSNQYFAVNNAGAGYNALPTTTKTLIFSRVSSTQGKIYYNGSLHQTLSVTSNSLNTRNVYLGAMNGIANTFYSNKQCAFASIGDGLTDTQANDLTTAINTFQTTLSRQV